MLLKLEESLIMFPIRIVPCSVSIQSTLPIEQFKPNHQRDIGRAEGRFSLKCKTVSQREILKYTIYHRNNLFLPVLENTFCISDQSPAHTEQTDTYQSLDKAPS